jgi:uncharacterized protein YjiK
MATDKTPIKIIAVIVIPLIIAVCIRFVSWNSDSPSERPADSQEKEQFLDLGSKKSVKIITSWFMPDDLLEVSGIAWIDAERFACVQDELGKVFIFNTRLNEIEQTIPFAGKGDYEGIAVVNDTIYILQSDGKIYEVINYKTGKPSVKVYKTHLGTEQDSESMAFDKKNNRLLVAIKAQEPDKNATYKGIYAFDLQTKKLSAAPVYKIDLTNEIFKEFNKGKIKNSISPSDIEVNPLNGDIYVLEGTKPKLLILDSKGVIKSLHDLKGSDFPQPEGLAFSSDGKMYISNEGKKKPGNILQVELLEK